MKKVLLILLLILQSAMATDVDGVRTMLHGTVDGQWRAPNGFPCDVAGQCLSNICIPNGVHGICESPGYTCQEQSQLCLNDCDCCSNRCASNGKCVADGVRECVPNSQRYNSRASECCSGRADSQGKCLPSPRSCMALQESCSRNDECCSLKCGSRGVCLPNNRMLRQQVIQEDAREMTK